jgi:hypothetical protein
MTFCHPVNNRFMKSNTTVSFNGYDFRYPLKKETINIYDLRVLHEKKKVLDLLENKDISILDKLNIINNAKLNNIIENEVLGPNLLKGGLLDDYLFDDIN